MTDEELDALCNKLRNHVPDVYEWEQAANAIAALRADRDSWEQQADDRVDDVLHMAERAEKAEADNAALLGLVRIADEVRKQCRICPATVSYDFARGRLAMREGKG